MKSLLLAMMCCSLLVLEACGFRLKGSQMVAVELPPVFLVGDTSSALLDDLRRALARSGTIIAADRGQAELILTVRNESRVRRAQSISAAGKVKEYELKYTVLFDVLDAKSRPVLMNQDITMFRNYAYEETDVLAKNTEEKFIYQEMRRSAVDSILRRLQALGSKGIPEQVDEIEVDELEITPTPEPQ